MCVTWHGLQRTKNKCYRKKLFCEKPNKNQTNKIERDQTEPKLVCPRSLASIVCVSSMQMAWSNMKRTVYGCLFVFLSLLNSLFCKPIFLTIPFLFQTCSESQCSGTTQSEESGTSHCRRKEEKDDTGYCKYWMFGLPLEKEQLGFLAPVNQYGTVKSGWTTPKSSPKSEAKLNVSVLKKKTKMHKRTVF